MKNKVQKVMDIYQLQQKALLKEATIGETNNKDRSDEEHKQEKMPEIFVENGKNEQVLETIEKGNPQKKPVPNFMNTKDFPKLTMASKATDKAKESKVVANPYGKSSNKPMVTKSPKRKKSKVPIKGIIK